MLANFRSSLSSPLFIRVGRKVLLSTIIVIGASEAIGAAFIVASPLPVPSALAFLFAFEGLFIATSALFSQLQYPLYALLIGSALIGSFRRGTSANSSDAHDIEGASSSISGSDRGQYLMLAM